MNKNRIDKLWNENERMIDQWTQRLNSLKQHLGLKDEQRKYILTLWQQNECYDKDKITIFDDDFSFNDWELSKIIKSRNKKLVNEFIKILNELELKTNLNKDNTDWWNEQLFLHNDNYINPETNEEYHIDDYLNGRYLALLDEDSKNEMLIYLNEVAYSDEYFTKLLSKLNIDYNDVKDLFDKLDAINLSVMSNTKRYNNNEYFDIGEDYKEEYEKLIDIIEYSLCKVIAFCSSEFIIPPKYTNYSASDYDIDDCTIYRLENRYFAIESGENVHTSQEYFWIDEVYRKTKTIVYYE